MNGQVDHRQYFKLEDSKNYCPPDSKTFNLPQNFMAMHFECENAIKKMIVDHVEEIAFFNETGFNDQGRSA